MSSVQSIRRAFDVLGALGGRAARRDRGRRTVGPAEVDRGPAAGDAGREGAVEQVPGDTVLPARAAARRPSPPGSAGPLAGRDRATDARRAGRRVRRGRRPGRPGRRPRPLHRPGRHAQPGLGPRLDRARGRRSTPSRPGRCCSRSGRRPPIERYLERPLERFTPRTLVDADAVRERLRVIRRERLRLGDRGVRRGHLVGRGADRGRVGRGHRRGPPPRAVVPLPAAGPRERAGRQVVVAGAARIAAELREV